jgi:hypothetical protein
MEDQLNQNLTTGEVYNSFLLMDRKESFKIDFYVWFIFIAIHLIGVYIINPIIESFIYYSNFPMYYILEKLVVQFVIGSIGFVIISIKSLIDNKIIRKIFSMLANLTYLVLVVLAIFLLHIGV